MPSRHLAAYAPEFASLIGRIGRCRLEASGRPPYEALIRAIAHQQVHAAAAEAMLGRMLARVGGEDFPTPGALLALPPGTLRECGFSTAKSTSILGIADAASSGWLPGLSAARRMPDAALIERLVTLRGVGRWTVEMLLIFTLGRPDVLPVDDFAVREGYRKLTQMPVQPTPKALAVVGLDWAPYRSTAAWYLWRAAEEGGRKGASAAI